MLSNKDYETMTIIELRKIAKELGVKNLTKYKKSELIEEIIKLSPKSIEKDGIVLTEKISPKSRNVDDSESIDEIKGDESKPYYNNMDDKEGTEESVQESKLSAEEKREKLKGMLIESDTAKGVLEINENNSFGFLRGKNYLSTPEDVYVSPSQIRRFKLRTGDEIEGKVRIPKEGEKFKALLYVEKVNGEDPDKAVGRKPFEYLTPIYPNKRLRLETKSQLDLASRLMDIICPIGMGQRGLIVAPPKAGKTTLLKKVAQNLSINYPCLLYTSPSPRD